MYVGDIVFFCKQKTATVIRLILVGSEMCIGDSLPPIPRHIMGLFLGQPGGRQFRRHLSENANKPGSGLEVVEQALAKVREPEPSLET